MTPRIMDANWVVKRAVGQNPAILGKKLKQHYFLGHDYLELDIDIASSSVAAGEKTPHLLMSDCKSHCCSASACRKLPVW